MTAQIDIVLLFDTEDIFSPAEVGNDDSIKELATILSDEGLCGTFLFTGDRALHLRDRGRPDVMAALAPHEVGLHTRSAFHLCSPEYVQRTTWEAGVEEALRHEREGVAIIEEVFGKPCCALSAHYLYTTPHSQRAAALLGLPYIYGYPSAPPQHSLSWYAGALTLPDNATAYYNDFDDAYPDDRLFGQKLRALDAHIDTLANDGQPFLSLLLYHPQRVRLAEFIDRFWSPNGVNYAREDWGRYCTPRRYSEGEVATALRNFRHLVQRLCHDERLRPVSVADIQRRYGTQPSVISGDELLAASRDICAADRILLHPRHSPAEIVVGLAQAVVHHAEQGTLPPEVVRRDVMGPTRNLLWYPEALAYTWQEIVERAREVLDHDAATGHLPALLGPDGARVGINHLYRAFAETVVAIGKGDAPASVALRPMPRYPDIAQEIGVRYLRIAEGDLLHPDLDVDALYRHGKLQTWTLKPAQAI